MMSFVAKICIHEVIDYHEAVFLIFRVQFLITQLIGLTVFLLNEVARDGYQCLVILSLGEMDLFGQKAFCLVFLIVELEHDLTEETYILKFILDVLHFVRCIWQ